MPPPDPSVPPPIKEPPSPIPVPRPERHRQCGSRTDQRRPDRRPLSHPETIGLGYGLIDNGAIHGGGAAVRCRVSPISAQGPIQPSFQPSFKGCGIGPLVGGVRRLTPHLRA